MPSSTRRPLRSRKISAFTLAEVLVSVVVLLLIFLIVIQFFDVVDQVWKSSAKDPFVDAQDAFEVVAAKLAAATLETYQDYADANGAFRAGSGFMPDHLARRSDLDFVCGPASGLLAAGNRTTIGSAVFFLAPEGDSQTFANDGMAHLLNAMGYFVEFGDEDSAPAFLSQFHRWRWRLKSVEQPAESLQVYSGGASSSWIQPMIAAGVTVPVLAENIVALVVLPERAANDSGTALAPNYGYDSRDSSNASTLHQLPPRLRLALVAIDSESADHLAAANGSNAPALISPLYFQQATQMTADLAQLDGDLTARHVRHRLFQREILLPSSSWSNTAAR